MLEENAEAVALFARCGTQWRYAPNGKAIGLGRANLRAEMDMIGVDDQADALWRVEALEEAFLKVRDEQDGNQN